MHRQHFAVRGLRELVSAVACSDGDGERVDPGAFDKFSSLIRVSEMYFS
jgi:hypothetical protein